MEVDLSRFGALEPERQKLIRVTMSCIQQLIRHILFKPLGGKYSKLTVSLSSSRGRLMAQDVESLVESYFKRATFLMEDIIDTIQNIKLKKYYLNVFIKKVGA